jgi:hypothetical protein
MVSDPAKIYPVRSEHVTWKALDGESVLLHLETGVYFSLNETGTAAWELFDGATPLAAVGETICARFKVSAEQVRQDLFELTRTLREEGLVEIREDPATSLGTDRS